MPISKSAEADAPILVTMGEPAGIGPEVTLAAFDALGGSVGRRPLRLVGDARCVWSALRHVPARGAYSNQGARDAQSRQTGQRKCGGDNRSHLAVRRADAEWSARRSRHRPHQ